LGDRALVPPGVVPRPSVPLGETGDLTINGVRDVTGYYIHARDGDIGHVEDFLVDDKAWTVRYLRVYTKGRWDGKSVLVAPKWLTELTEDDSKKFFCIVTAVEDKAAPRPAILAPEHRHAASLPFRPGRTTPRRR
jgi:hypothetical protein